MVGFIYDLGSRTLHVFKIPDHTPDGIALLDKKERLLFTGDEFMTIGKHLNVSLTTFWGFLEKLLAHRSEFDRLCAGGGVYDGAFLDSYYECTQYILNGHRGEPFIPQPKEKRIVEKDEYGQIIYDRIHPHPGDGGTDDPPAEAIRYRMVHSGVEITYSQV